jgi:hypothetical protein
MTSREPSAHRTRGTPPRWWQSLSARALWALCLALALAEPGAARADDPADVVPSASLAIPEAPRDFVREKLGQVTWDYHASSASIVRELQGELPQALRNVARELGGATEQELTVRIARSPDELVRLAPPDAPPPRYAVGVAYPALGLVILSTVAPDTWLPPDMSRVLVHELSHVVLHRAVGGRRLPLWFVEGVAVHQAGEQNMARVRTLWEAAVVGEVLPLGELSRRFPTRPHEVNRAYAQSADLVEHLLRADSDPEQLARMLRRVAQGRSFDDAVLATYRVDLATLDREWRHGLSERFRVLPLVLTGTALWGGIALLAVLAFVRRRKQHREKLRRWGDEEAAYERAMAALDLQRQADMREELALRQGYPVPVPLPREPGVPTVEHDGQRHTLH